MGYKPNSHNLPIFWSCLQVGHANNLVGLDGAQSKHTLGPAAAEEGAVGDEPTPQLAYRGAAKQRGDVGHAHKDLQDDVVRERGGRLDSHHRCVLVLGICRISDSVPNRLLFQLLPGLVFTV